MKAPLVALVLMAFWVTVHKSEEILQNKRGVNISKEETLNKSKRLTVQDSFSSEVEEEVERKDKGRQFYQRSLKILKHSKNKEDTEKAHRLLVKAAKMGNQKAMEQLASDMLFGNNVPQNVEAAVSLYEILAEEGSHKGQTALGFLSSYGIGVEYSQSKALVYYTFASHGGNLISQMILGYRYWLGINVPRSCEAALLYYKKVADYIASKLEENEDKPVEKVKLMERSENLGFDTEILDWDVHQYYKFLAERGDTQIQMYLEGSATVPQSNIAALKYFKMAAEKGNSIGLWGLGLIYLRGKGLPRNHSEAFKYFHKAAEKGYAQAQFQLGLMYHNGSGVKRDYKLAFQYFYLASQNGQPLAVYHLAEMYATGMGAFRSCQNAVKLYRTVCELGRWSDKFLTAHFAYQTGNVDSSLVQYALLAEMGYEVAQCNSAHIMESENVKLLHREQIYPLALLLWKRAANQGNIFARVKTGDYHFYGFGIKRDYLTAAVHYNLAANQQSAQAMFNLAYMYEYGLGIPKDIHLARRWYDLAAETSTDAFIPVFLAYIRLEVMHLFTDLQLLKQMGNWKLPDLDHMLRLHWDLIVMIVIVLLLILLISSRQN
ncbi:protein sel-1 homolog 2 isoform X4 [Podarcis lilfordi]|uniref:Protein sel-1 homolog 2 isoform X4 n=2 Tax=Podarcis lilfordi TaxID=74358 RepID=A0AA35K0N8_9SAUR|nr:protein sel-1 homolog 2 isoform X4 [Podarcis lilfordi]